MRAHRTREGSSSSHFLGLDLPSGPTYKLQRLVGIEGQHHSSRSCLPRRCHCRNSPPQRSSNRTTSTHHQICQRKLRTEGRQTSRCGLHHDGVRLTVEGKIPAHQNIGFSLFLLTLTSGLSPHHLASPSQYHSFHIDDRSHRSTKCPIPQNAPSDCTGTVHTYCQALYLAHDP